MRNLLTLALLGAMATAAGCGISGGNGSGSSATTQPASRADASAPSPGASPTVSPPKAAKSAGNAKAGSPTTSQAQAGQVLGVPAGWEIAPRADYTARQAAGRVTITAKGESPTTGYEVKLIESPLRIWPPQWILAHKKPEGAAGQAITPFETSASFKADRRVATVIVNDASGRRTVSVAQAQN